MLSIEMLKMIPKPPYRIDVYDVLQIRASFALPDQPIAAEARPPTDAGVGVAAAQS